MMRKFLSGLTALMLVVIVILPSLTLAVEYRSGVKRIEQLANCFAFGIDSIGRGEIEAGQARWETCYDDSLEFNFTIVSDAPIIECPGPNCPVQDGSVGADLRTKFADFGFKNRGYVATQHVMTNLDVTRSGRRGRLQTYLTATHVLPDGSIDLWNGVYMAEAVRKHGRWLITKETVEGISFGNIETSSVPFN